MILAAIVDESAPKDSQEILKQRAERIRGLPPKSGGDRELQRLLSELEGIGL